MEVLRPAVERLGNSPPFASCTRVLDHGLFDETLEVKSCGTGEHAPALRGPRQRRGGGRGRLSSFGCAWKRLQKELCNDAMTQ